MTTAHRPTFDPARGKEAARGEAYHQRLLPAHKTLKFRQAGQGTCAEQARRDLRAELLRAEATHYAQKGGRAIGGAGAEADGDGDGDGGIERQGRIGTPPAGDPGPAAEEDYEAKKRRVLAETRHVDADSDAAASSADGDSDTDSDSDDDEDEAAELMRELAKIKAERAEKAAREAAEQAQKDAEQRERDIALGNPLLNPHRHDFGVKRRWDDDVVFKNQARGTHEAGREKRFVNDLLRSDFHKRFMDKYVR